MKRILYITAVLLTACQETVIPVSNARMCEQTVRDYGPLRDDGPADAYADLFTEDATFQLGNTVTQGREALIARHISANKASRWRHNMIDIRIDDDKLITGTTRFIVYVGDNEVGASPVVREIIGDYIDTFVIEEDGCKIATRRVKIVFDSLR